MKIKPDTVPYSVPRPNNMVIVRYFLALAITINHFNVLGGYEVPFFISGYSRVGGFFAISGFLIYGYYLRHANLKNFIIGRAIRILPAYWATVLLFAIGLVAVSTLSFGDYFLSGQFWKYLGANLSFLNFLAPDLPGVFTGFEHTAVNGALWTMKVEWVLYLSVPLVVWFLSQYRKNPPTLFVLLYVISVIYRIIFAELFEATGKPIYEILERQFLGQLMYFYIGVLIYFYYSTFVKYRYQILIVSLAIMASADYLPYFLIIFHPLAFSALVIWFSMLLKPLPGIDRHTNISYNIYLVHFPIIQTFVYLGVLNSMGVVGALALTLATTIVVALLINRLIEKPIQRRLDKYKK